jgi:hypothetical protein
VHNLIILDEGGSMDDIRETIVSGFSEVIQTVRDVPTNFLFAQIRYRISVIDQ